ncbi:hypothetical protein [Oscillatoria sp. FACHB-1407]|nr:hypothetical protein [Oscillatoria sp. FACHB-1407]
MNSWLLEPSLPQKSRVRPTDAGRFYSDSGGCNRQNPYPEFTLG